MQIISNSRYFWDVRTFDVVQGYSNSNYVMLVTKRTFPTYSIVNRRTGEFVNSGVTRDHAVRCWNRTGVMGLPPMAESV